MTSRTLTIAHECGHLVAHHLLGSLGNVVLVEIPKGGHAGGGATGRVGLDRSVADLTRTRGDAEGAIVTALAGAATMRELGLPDHGSEDDEQLAGTVALQFTDWDAEAAVTMYDECAERCALLVTRDDFQHLVVRLAGYLEDVPAISGRRVGELLQRWEYEFQSSTPLYRQPSAT